MGYRELIAVAAVLIITRCGCDAWPEGTISAAPPTPAVTNEQLVYAIRFDADKYEVAINKLLAEEKQAIDKVTNEHTRFTDPLNASEHKSDVQVTMEALEDSIQAHGLALFDTAWRNRTITAQQIPLIRCIGQAANRMRPPTREVRVSWPKTPAAYFRLLDQMKSNFAEKINACLLANAFN